MQRPSDFAYELPAERIAQFPSDRRDDSRLMVLDAPEAPVRHAVFRDLPDFLKAGDLLVLNDTKVVRARLACRRESGARVEALVLGPSPHGGTIDAMLKSSAKLREGERLTTGHASARLVLREKKDRGRWSVDVEGASIDALFDETGRAPLPPYIRRDSVSDAADPDDLDRYQTVYACNPGAVAAPTAGLHFTPEVFAELERRGIATTTITLHVGPGTFLPVRSETVDEHEMLPEYYRIDGDAARRIRETRASGGRVIAVGTTACRALETARPSEADGETEGWTDLFVVPGFRFGEVDGMLTNFHMPESTLLMLVAAFAGRERILDAYREAVRLEYRFFSYGDAMLILPTAKVESREGGGP